MSEACKRRGSTPAGAASAADSEGPVAAVIMGGLAHAAQPAAHPIGDPVDHAAERHRGIAEEPEGLGAIDQPAGVGFGSDEVRYLSEPLAERRGKHADADRLGTAEIERARRL